MKSSAVLFTIIVAVLSPLACLLVAIALILATPFAPIVWVTSVIRRERRINRGRPNNAQEFAEWMRRLGELQQRKAAAAAVIQHKGTTQNSAAN